MLAGAGWEGTAVLHYGSYIKFGCLHFVFSIAECNTLKKRKQSKRREKETSVNITKTTIFITQGSRSTNPLWLSSELFKVDWWKWCWLGRQCRVASWELH